MKSNRGMRGTANTSFWYFLHTTYHLKVRFAQRQAARHERKQRILLKQMRGWGIGGFKGGRERDQMKLNVEIDGQIDLALMGSMLDYVRSKVVEGVPSGDLRFNRVKVGSWTLMTENVCKHQTDEFKCNSPAVQKGYCKSCFAHLNGGR